MMGKLFLSGARLTYIDGSDLWGPVYYHDEGYSFMNRATVLDLHFLLIKTEQGWRRNHPNHYSIPQSYIEQIGEQIDNKLASLKK